MALDNQITIIGNLTRDPELRMTRNDNALVNVGVAVNRRVNNNGQWEDKLDGYFNVTIWNDYARNVARSLKKGDRVVVIGRMVQSTYKDQQGNEQRSFDIQADEVTPSLKWATAQVERTSRGGNYGNSNSYNSGGVAPSNAGNNYANVGNPNNAGFPPAPPASADSQPYSDSNEDTKNLPF